MKKITLTFVLLFSVNAFSQWNSASIKLGVFNPQAVDGGFIIGYEGNHFFDNRLSLGWSVDWFHKNYVDSKLVGDFNQYYGGVDGTINELRAKTNIHDFPFMLNMTANFPVARFTKFYLTGGIGAEVLLINYRNFQNPDQDEIKGAFDFNWQIGMGILYEIGRRSDVFGELAYHNSAPSWTYEVTDNFGYTRTFERSFDMSGIMFRVGFRFYY